MVSNWIYRGRTRTSNSKRRKEFCS